MIERIGCILVYLYHGNNISISKKLTSDSIVVITFILTRKEVIDEVDNLSLLLILS